MSSDFWIRVLINH